MMSDKTDWAGAFQALVFWGFVLACIVLTAGTPDLLDAITANWGCKP